MGRGVNAGAFVCVSIKLFECPRTIFGLDCFPTTFLRREKTLGFIKYIFSVPPGTSNSIRGFRFLCKNSSFSGFFRKKTFFYRFQASFEPKKQKCPPGSSRKPAVPFPRRRVKLATPLLVKKVSDRMLLLNKANF